MASEYERQAWARFGPAVGQIFQDYGQQRARRAEFDASIAQDELRRRDAKDAQNEMADIRRRTLELSEEAAAESLKRYDIDQERIEEDRALADDARRLQGGALRGYQSPEDIGRVASKEYVGGIREAGGQGLLPQIRAAVTGFAPALQKGVQEAPVTSYAGNMAQFAKDKNLSDDQLGNLYDAAPQLFEPNYENLTNAASAYIQFGVTLPDEFAYLQPRLDERADEINAEKDDIKRRAMLDEEIKTVQLDRLRNPGKYAVRSGTRATKYSPDQKLEIGGDLTDAEWKSLGVDPANEEQKAAVRANIQKDSTDSAALDAMLNYGTGTPASTNVSEDGVRVGGLELAAGLKAALGENSRESLEADLVATYGFTDEGATAMLDRILAGEFDEAIAAMTTEG